MGTVLTFSVQIAVTNDASRYDAERGTKVVGHRGYFLKKWGVFLNQAIINYGLEFLDNKGYIPLQTPQLMLKEQMAKTAQLSQFDEELYKVTGDQADKYLIAVSRAVCSPTRIGLIPPRLRNNQSAPSTARNGSSPRSFP